MHALHDQHTFVLTGPWGLLLLAVLLAVRLGGGHYALSIEAPAAANLPARSLAS